MEDFSRRSLVQKQMVLSYSRPQKPQLNSRWLWIMRYGWKQKTTDSEKILRSEYPIRVQVLHLLFTDLSCAQFVDWSHLPILKLILIYSSKVTLDTLQVSKCKTPPSPDSPKKVPSHTQPPRPKKQFPSLWQSQSLISSSVLSRQKASTADRPNKDGPCCLGQWQQTGKAWGHCPPARSNDLKLGLNWWGGQRPSPRGG